MKDLLLNKNGDLVVNPTTGVSITDSVAQAVTIRLKWFFDEWRFAPKYGVPYYEEILVKNPSNLRIRQIIRDEILSVEEVEQVTKLNISVLPNRRARITFTALVAGVYSELEVIIDA